MANFSGSDFTNKISNITVEGETRLNPTVQVSFIIAIIINSITCPFTVLLNVLVIMAVKRRPRLQSNSNILLSCLAATDAFTGLAAQPSFILWATMVLLERTSNARMALVFYGCTFRISIVCSSLHLMLVTFERLIAIRFTIHYPYMITEKNIKVAVTTFWVFAFSFGVLGYITQITSLLFEFNLFIAIFVLVSCVLFILSSYIILYRETLRHEKMIKTQQLPQEEVERFVKERKALKTTVYVVGAIVLCFLPTISFLAFNGLANAHGVHVALTVFAAWSRTSGMLNSFLNPLIYCWRQKEMRNFVFRFRTQAVNPAY